MISSVSISRLERISNERRGASSAVCLGIFVTTFAALIIVPSFTRYAKWWDDRRIAAVHARIPADSDQYLANFHGGVEHMALFHGFDGIPAQLRRADVLLLGDSHMQFDWPRETVEPFCRARHFTYYNMAFGWHETSAFPIAIIRKYDLRPKYVVIKRAEKGTFVLCLKALVQL